MRYRLLALLLLLGALGAGCDLLEESVIITDSDRVVLDDMPEVTETGTVTRVIDGDTIDVELDNGGEERIRYIGVNTPERDEACYRDATQANRDLVQGQRVQLVPDDTNRDRFGRLLRYVFVGDVFVGATLVRNGYAEVVLYEPDDRYFNLLNDLEDDATDANRGCHPTGIFDDGTRSR
jgi:micrococcal nuclease